MANRLARRASSQRKVQMEIDEDDEPNFRNGEPTKWSMKAVTYNGSLAGDFKTEKVTGPIKEGQEKIKQHPAKYLGMTYTNNLEGVPEPKQSFTLILRKGDPFMFATDPSPEGTHTLLTMEYQRLPPFENNVLPKTHRDEFTDDLIWKGKPLYNRQNKPLLPGRGMGIFDKPCLKVIGDVDPTDVRQGLIGDCWMLSGISTLVEYEGAVQRLFRKTKDIDSMPHDINPNLYTITLFDVRTWEEVDVVVDERLCLRPDWQNKSGLNRLLGAKPSKDGQLWVPYLEKAVAIHCGGWDQVNYGANCNHAWAVLTGVKEQCTIMRKEDEAANWGCYGKYDPREGKWLEQDNDPWKGDQGVYLLPWPETDGKSFEDWKDYRECTDDQLFQKLCAWNTANMLLAASSKGESDQNKTDGIVDNHSYGIVVCRSNIVGTGQDLIQLRNPWGQDGELDNGMFARGKGSGWAEYPAIKKELNPDEDPPGVFWLTKEEFFKYYGRFYLSGRSMHKFLGLPQTANPKKRKAAATDISAASLVKKSDIGSAELNPSAGIEVGSSDDVVDPQSASGVIAPADPSNSVGIDQNSLAHDNIYPISAGTAQDPNIEFSAADNAQEDKVNSNDPKIEARGRKCKLNKYVCAVIILAILGGGLPHLIPILDSEFFKQDPGILVNATGTPTTSPTATPTAATLRPTISPAPTMSPTRSSAPTITAKPTDTIRPSSAPTNSPSEIPSSAPTIPAPSKGPTDAPSRSLTKSPTDNPTRVPTLPPTPKPSFAPTTPSPTRNPSIVPIGTPSRFPTVAPYLAPTRVPTKTTTPTPTKNPTRFPTDAPATPGPTKNPTRAPTVAPTTLTTTGMPTVKLTKAPTNAPTKAPTKVPIQAPTRNPTVAPVTTPPTLSPLTGLLVSISGEQAFDNPRSAQSRALNALLKQGFSEQDARTIKGRERYASAVFYFSTGGDDNWYECFRGHLNCGSGQWFNGDTCSWKYITCNNDGFITSIKFDKENGLIGSIPMEIWSLQSLEVIEIVDNRNMNGPLPTKFGETATKMVFFRIENSGLTGSIPDGFLSNSPVQLFNLAKNSLIGNVPASVFNLSSLRQLYLNGNRGLTGSLLPSINNLSNLIELRVSNTQMGGRIPDEFFSLQNLVEIDLSAANFRGPISRSFVGFSDSLNRLYLDNNSFSGTIPAVFGQLSNLNKFTLHANEVTGIISPTICSLRGSGPFDLQVLTVDCDEVACSCCTACF